MRTITLSGRERRKAEIVSRLAAGGLDVKAASEMLGVGERQAYRLQARFRQEGLAAVKHGNAGRPAHNRTDPALVERIVSLAGPGGKYQDLNVSHLQEMLAEVEQIAIGRSTLDRLLHQAGVRQRGRRAQRVHRRRRERRPAEGMLLQIDGSPFAWLEGRGPKGTLLGAIDDATGKVLYLHFRPSEDQVGYLLLLRTIARQHGLPMSIYHDRHTILRSPKQPTVEDELAGQAPMSQIQRVMSELGIEAIQAYSPQAKGRIERLWGTLQDRLTKELRLAGVDSLEAANAFLPGFIARYNHRFAHAPQDPHSAWVPLPDDLDISYYFAHRETRTVRADHCISFAGQTLQLLPAAKAPSLVNQKIAVHLVPEGEITLYHGQQPVPYRLLAAPQPTSAPPSRRPRPAKEPNPQAAARRRAWLYAQP